MDDDKITYFAETDARNKRVKFGIKAKDRTRHVYVLGKTGMGKSTLLENMAVQDIKSGEGICFIDPHGKTADLLMEYVPKERVNDVIYIAPFDTEYPISFNVLESVDQDKRHLVVSGLMSTFKKIWEDAWSARMEYILTNTLLALLEAPGSTLLGVNRMLSDKDYRREIVSHIKDPSVKAFWTKEFASYTERMAAEAVPAIQNKVGQFTANPLIRNMIGQPHSSFDFREAMDRRKIILINLSKGKIGDENMKLLGGLLVTKIYLAAMSRSDVHDRAMKLLPNFYLFVDEFQNFANASFADILSEARKYKLNLTIAHQYVEQMDELVRPAVFGNVGTMIIFRVGATDAEALENEFTPQFTIEDLVNLGFAQIYLKLMIDGLTSPPFSAVTLPPIPHPDSSYVQEIIAASRKQFSRPRADVEAEVIKFHEPIPKPPPAAVTATAKPSSTAKTPSPKTPAAAQPMPPKQPAPAPTHKPFAVLKQVVVPTPSAAKPSAQPVSPASSASTPVPQASTPVPVQPAPAPVKPVPLSFLAPKPAPRVDPKVPVKKNVDDLRSALSAALGGKLPTPVPAQEPLRETSLAKPIEKTQPARPPQETASVEPAAPKREAPKGPPKEVPEEILKKLLKMEE
jgi:energy-coupling factor transporter ATP-binding protein EcfA2